MLYHFKRAVGFSLLLYVLTFIVGIIAGIITNQDTSSLSAVSPIFWYVGMVAAVVLTIVITRKYFRNRAIAPSLASGVLFGITAVVVSSLLDFGLFSLGNAGGANVDLGVYYGDYRYWIIIALVIASAAATAKHKQRDGIRV